MTQRQVNIADARAKALVTLTPEQVAEVTRAQAKKAELAHLRREQARVTRRQQKESQMSTPAAKTPKPKAEAKPKTASKAKPVKRERMPTVFAVTAAGKKALSAEGLKGHRAQIAPILLKLGQATNQQIADLVDKSGGWTRKTKAPSVGVVGSQMHFFKVNGFVEVVKQS